MRRLPLVIVSGLLVVVLTGCSTIIALVKGVVRTTEPLRFHQVTETTAPPCTGDLRYPDPSIASQCVRLGQSRLEVTELRSVEATNSGVDWVVVITLPDEAASTLADLTGELATQPDPQNRLALVLGDDLIAAPMVTDRIEGGTLQINGIFTQREAEDLAGRLGG